MRSILIIIICITTSFLPSVSFASTAKDFHYSQQFKLSIIVSADKFLDVEDIEDDDLQSFEFKNCWVKQNNKYFVLLNSQKDFDQSLKTVLSHNNLFYPMYPLFILHQVFTI